MSKFPTALVFFLMLLVVSSVEGQYSQSSSLPVSTVAFSGTRDVPLIVRVVFLGLTNSDLNSSYLTAEINVPSVKPQAILAGSQNTGVNYRFEYKVVFADNATLTEFASFLRGIELAQATVPEVGSLRNPYFDNSTTEISSVTNYFYDASRVENWFASSPSFAPSPVPGYTFFVADLHNYLPSFTYQQYQNYNTKCTIATSGPRTGLCSNPSRGMAAVHYYNRTMVEPDLGLVQSRHFMTGWGGNQRFYYLDLSAGPSYWTEELPVQVASQLRGVDLASAYGRYRRTQFIADYLSGVVYNLFAPDQVYPVSYSSQYNFHLFIFDNRNSTEMANGPTLRSTVNETLIRSELGNFLPYSNLTVVAKYANVSDYAGLEAVVASATTSIEDPAVNGSIVDLRLVYNWLSDNGEGHISQFIDARRDSEQFDIPAFIFAFTSRYNFGFTFKDDVFLHSNPDSIYGVALGDLVLISHGQYDLRAGDYPSSTGQTQPGKGIGFTRTIIHELGHMLGLAHPFSYDATEDFTDTVMGYYANSLTFSQFDKDMLLRGVNDELLIFAQVTLANTTNNLFNSARISAAKRAIVSADEKYGAMRYAEAVLDSFDAAVNAFSAHQLAGAGPFAIFSSAVVFGIIGLAVGSGVGLLAGYLVFRRRQATGIQYYRCPTCQQPLRWDAVMMRWYCDRCQKPY